MYRIFLMFKILSWINFSYSPVNQTIQTHDMQEAVRFKWQRSYLSSRAMRTAAVGQRDPCPVGVLSEQPVTLSHWLSVDLMSWSVLIKCAVSCLTFNLHGAQTGNSLGWWLTSCALLTILLKTIFSSISATAEPFTGTRVCSGNCVQLFHSCITSHL